MNEKFSIPGAIVLAGIIIAGAIYFSRVPVSGPRQEARPPAERLAGPATPAPVDIQYRPIDPARDHIRGAENAQVTLLEYSDTECPFCKRFHPTLQQALQEYNGRVRWVYRHFPIEQLHSKAPKEAEATECAGKQGKFWEFTDKVYEVTPSNDGLDPAELPKIAQEVGLDVAAFKTCLQSGEMAQRVLEDLEDVAKAGGQGTPYTVIIGPKGETVPFSGAQPYSSLKQVIDGLLAKK